MCRRAPWLFFVVVLSLFSATRSIAAEDERTEIAKELILPGESFLIEACPSFILLPAEENRQKPQPWIMYAPTLPGLPDSHEKWMHEEFLAAGVAVSTVMTIKSCH